MPIYTYVGLGAMALIVIVWQVLARLRDAPSARAKRDARDPDRRWIQGVLAIYRGDVGDPGYWPRERASGEMTNGWSTPDSSALHALLDRYVAGECNVAFDKVRIIWLARMGAGAGWIDEATSWRLCLQAKQALQTEYADWNAMTAAMEVGRAQWYGGADKITAQKRAQARAHVDFATTSILGGVSYR